MKIVPRSAVFGPEGAEGVSRAMQNRSMPSAAQFDPRAARPGTAAFPDQPALHQVALLKGQLIKVHNDRARIVKEANAKLGALAAEVARLRGRNTQLEGFMRTAYSPNLQMPGRGQVDVSVPTHALRNPNLYTVDGSRGAPPAVADDARAGAPGTAAHGPGDGAVSVEETVRAQEHEIFYGSGDAAFYEGGEND